MEKVGRFKFSTEEFKNAISASINWSEVIRKLFTTTSGSRLAGLRRHAAALGVDTSHLLGRSSMKGKTVAATRAWGSRRPLESILTKDSIYKSGSNGLKKRLIKSDYLKNQCVLCGNEGSWMGMQLILQLDHIDGDSQNNELSNLRILCPNCHTQTHNWGAKRR